MKHTLTIDVDERPVVASLVMAVNGLPDDEARSHGNGEATQHDHFEGWRVAGPAQIASCHAECIGQPKRERLNHGQVSRLAVGVAHEGQFSAIDIHRVSEPLVVGAKHYGSSEGVRVARQLREIAA